MISALASGTLIRAPKSGTSASGTVWANTTIRCSTGQNREGEAESSFVNVLCFGDVAEKLVKLDKGDSISCQGPLKQGQYEKDGETRHTLEIVAQAILSPYQIQKKRDDSQANTKHASHSDREQNRAYDQFAKGVKQSSQVTEDFNDELTF
jgi:single-strand DNA-binding protein